MCFNGTVLDNSYEMSEWKPSDLTDAQTSDAKSAGVFFSGSFLFFSFCDTSFFLFLMIEGDHIRRGGAM